MQVERRRLDELLLVPRQASEAVREGIGDAKFREDDIAPVVPIDYVLQSVPGMIRRMNSSNKGTVNAVSPW